jgi:hypothetical protein
MRGAGEHMAERAMTHALLIALLIRIVLILTYIV